MMSNLQKGCTPPPPQRPKLHNNLSFVVIKNQKFDIENNVIPAMGQVYALSLSFSCDVFGISETSD